MAHSHKWECLILWTKATEKLIKGFGQEYERKRSHGRSRYKWKDKIKMNLKERNQLRGHGLEWRAEKGGRL
jgi:hypothetical protein